MQLQEILDTIAINLDMRSSDGATILEGRIRKSDLIKQVNRVYREVIAQQLIDKNQDDFTVTAQGNTYRANFMVASIDAVNNLINSSINVFGRADVGSQIQNPATNEFYTIIEYITSTQVKVDLTPQVSLVSANVYVLNNIIVLDEGLEDLKEILNFQIKYNDSDYRWVTCARETGFNFLDKSDRNNSFGSRGIYSITTIEMSGAMKRCLTYHPYPTNYDGVFRLVYTKLPPALVSETDEPMLNAIGVSEVIINAVTAWGLKIKKELEQISLYQESNPKYGGVIPMGLTLCLESYKSRRNAPIKYKAIRR
jgi:hypothetical protein